MDIRPAPKGSLGLEAKLSLKVGEHISEVGKKLGVPWTLYTRASGSEWCHVAQQTYSLHWITGLQSSDFVLIKF